MPDPTLQGIVTAVVTPFRDDERIDFNAWQNLIDRQIAAGVDGLLVAGGQGEFFALTPEERVVAVRFCRQAAGRRVPVYANVGCPGTRYTIQLAQSAQEDGVACLVVITPYYVRPSGDELAEHYIEVCRAVHLPVIAYNLPDRTGVDLTPEVVRRVAGTCENFAGIKDSTGDLDRLTELVEIGGTRPFSVFTGLDHQILPALGLGCQGAISGGANILPHLFADLLRALRAGDTGTANRLQELATSLAQTFRLHTFPSVIKHAMRLIGLPPGPGRRPIGPLPPEADQMLAEVLDRLRESGYPRP